MAIIEVDKLSKTFLSVKKEAGVKGGLKSLFTREKVAKHAVKGVSFTLEKGEIVGFLGPNGAGKTTTIKMLSGILYPTSGHCQVLGYEPFARNPNMLKKMSLVMGNKNQLWWDLAAIDSFRLLRELYGVSQNDFDHRLKSMAAELDMTEKINLQVRKMSLGERMKCELIASLLHRPEVLFLDEPTIGLDLMSQKKIREFLLKMNQQDECTILLTSHYMQDVEEMCERVIMIDEGVVGYDGTLENLKSGQGAKKRVKVTFAHSIPDTVLKSPELVEQESSTATLVFPAKEATQAASRYLSEFDVVDIAIEEEPIEDVIRRYMASASA
jgi:ABC-2 type transport system ATP-binding protein